MKLHRYNSNILNAEDQFGHNRDASTSPENLSQLAVLAVKLLNDKNLEVSKVRPFFWTLVETYLDRFQRYPFDVNRALFSYLESNNYPEETTLELVKQLESQFEKQHGHPLREPVQSVCSQATLDDEMKALRDSLKYAAMVAETE